MNTDVLKLHKKAESFPELKEIYIEKAQQLQERVDAVSSTTNVESLLEDLDKVFDEVENQLNTANKGDYNVSVNWSTSLLTRTHRPVCV